MTFCIFTLQFKKIEKYKFIEIKCLNNYLFYLTVPPDILDYPTSTDMAVREGGNVSMQCAASGFPTPSITWRKEGGHSISLSPDTDGKSY